VSTQEQRTYTCDVGEIRRMSAWWREWATSNALSVEARDRGELCLNEVAANIVRHAGAPSAIEISLEADANVVRMTIADDAGPFNLLTHPAVPLPRTLDDASRGGLGIHIVRSSVTDLSYCRSNGRNMLTLTLTR
jgi:anti-sigma regulatory factor (Ser/Thr protein kinase)